MGTSKLSGKPDEKLGVTCDGLASRPGGVAILLVASFYRNWGKLWQLCESGLCFNLHHQLLPDRLPTDYLLVNNGWPI